MELQRSSDLTVEGANVVFNQTQNKELVHMIVSMIQRSGDGDNTSLSIMDERPVIEDKIMLDILNAVESPGIGYTGRWMNECSSTGYNRLFRSTIS